MATAAGGAPATLGQLALCRLAHRHTARFAKFGDQELFGAAAVPVMVFVATQAKDVLDDDVLAADLDLAVTGGAAVELARDAPDQPGLVALVGQAAHAPAFVGQA